MNQEKIGKFIANQRKEKGLTQEQLAERIGVTNKSISRWENGKTMPDISLFEPLCRELDISINELLKGKKLENKKDLEVLSAEALTEYSKYLKRHQVQKNILLLIVMLLSLITGFLMLVLLFNETFFKTTYNSKFVDNVHIPIPRFSYYRRTGGMGEYTTQLKTLKQPDAINVFADVYLSSLDKMECHGETYYYNRKRDFTIISYRGNNDGIGIVNTIYISYADGNICDE